MLARRFVQWLVSSTDRALDALGIGALSLELAPGERQRIMIASAPPAVLLFATLYQLGFQIDQGDQLLPTAGEEWRRLNAAASILVAVLPFLSAGLLFCHGVGPVSRGLGTWCLVVTLSLFGVSGLLIAYVSAIEILVSPFNFYTRADLHPGLGSDAATNCAIVALGYAYLAYRGLAAEAEVAVIPE
jgi:hypothetical protein